MTIERVPFSWLNEESREFLRRGYLFPDEDPIDRITDMATRASSLHEPLFKMDDGAGRRRNWEYEEKFIRYMGLGYYSLASPIWSNFGRARGLPISCFGSNISDTLDSILQTAHEVGMMSKYGGGTAAYFGNVRGRGQPITDNGESEGSVNFMRLFDTLIDVSKQGETRRGATAVYLPIDHDDIEEFLDIRDDGHPIQNLFPAVTVPDGWMQSMIDGDADKRRVWSKVLQRRSEVGLPYITFMDNANNHTSPYHGTNSITHSNLCSEIMLPTSEYESFVCCLSSMNLLHYQEWKDTDAVEVLTWFLDAVMEEFVQKSESMPGLRRAHRFAKNHRAIGIGVLGWSSYLQSQRIPFGSLVANAHNVAAFQHIQRASYEASEWLGRALGVPVVAQTLGLPRRNTTTMAVAPTTSSSYILGQVSQSIEPYKSNYYVRDLAKRSETFRNPYLQELLAEKNKDTPDVWADILAHDGSVQHLDFLTEDERDVFKTFEEISQLDIIVQAASRQEYIDQGQSLNITVHPDTPVRDINELHIEAWRRGVKGLYYQHTSNAAQAFNRDLLNCSSCEA